MSDEKLAQAYALYAEGKHIDAGFSCCESCGILASSNDIRTVVRLSAFDGYLAGLKAEREKSKKLVEALKLISLGEAGSSLIAVEKYVIETIKEYEKEGAE